MYRVVDLSSYAAALLCNDSENVKDYVVDEDGDVYHKGELIFTDAYTEITETAREFTVTHHVTIRRAGPYIVRDVLALSYGAQKDDEAKG